MERRDKGKEKGEGGRENPLPGDIIQGMTLRKISEDVQGTRGKRLSSASLPPTSQRIWANPRLPETLFWSAAPKALSFPSLARSWSLLSPHWWGLGKTSQELRGGPLYPRHYDRNAPVTSLQRGGRERSGLVQSEANVQRTQSA